MLRRLITFGEGIFPAQLLGRWRGGLLLLEQFAEDTNSIRSGNCELEFALGMDQHGAQKTTAYQKRLHALKVFGLYTPAGCTDVTAPVDHQLGLQLKRMMGAFYDLEYKQNRGKWQKPARDGGLTASERRILLATWLGASWQMMRADSEYYSTGFRFHWFSDPQRWIRKPSDQSEGDQHI